MGLGALWHREALFGLRLGVGSCGFARPPLRRLVWTSAVQCRDHLTPGHGVSDLAHYWIVGGAKPEAAWL